MKFLPLSTRFTVPSGEISFAASCQGDTLFSSGRLSGYSLMVLVDKLGGFLCFETAATLTLYWFLLNNIYIYFFSFNL